MTGTAESKVELTVMATGSAEPAILFCGGLSES